MKIIAEKEAHADRAKAEAELMSAHPDFDEIRNDQNFHDWVETQPELIKQALYENESDAKESQEKISSGLNVPLDQLKVEITDSKAFWIAEKYHQDFAVKNSLKYNFYRTSCGRDNRLKKVWSEYK